VAQHRTTSPSPARSRFSEPVRWLSVRARMDTVYRPTSGDPGSRRMNSDATALRGSILALFYCLGLGIRSSSPRWRPSGCPPPHRATPSPTHDRRIGGVFLIVIGFSSHGACTRSSSGCKTTFRRGEQLCSHRRLVDWSMKLVTIGSFASGAPDHGRCGARPLSSAASRPISGSTDRRSLHLAISCNSVRSVASREPAIAHRAGAGHRADRGPSFKAVERPSSRSSRLTTT